MRVPSPAMAVALVALFVALGGTGYAVSAIPKDSVGSPQLRDPAVKEADLGTKAVGTGKVADQAITREKLAPGAVSGDRVGPDALSGAQIDESTLGRVPSAQDAAHATAAERGGLAARAARAGNADSATHADRAALADKLAGVTRKSQPYSVPDQGYLPLTVACDAGQVAVGGGYESDPSSDIPFVASSAPTGGAWRLEFYDIF